MKRAFSLVELSIVLVILGLLVGGVLAGQSLIRAAQLRSMISDMQRHQAAFQAFRDKYFALPGDMTNAVSFWGQDTASSCTNTPAAGDRVAKTATCNGNGDGQIISNTNEEFRTWQQLANAGLIEGSYTGVTGPNSAGDNDPGINSPLLKMGNQMGASVYYIGYVPPGSAAAYLFEGNYGNTFSYGLCASYECINGGLKPDEAWNIDTKLDDGLPGLGKLITRVSNVVSGSGDCTTSTSNAAGQAAAATYNFTATDKACAFYLRGTM